jgi:dihydroxy-acid dehydratase
MRQTRAFASAGAESAQAPAHGDVIEIAARQGRVELRLSGAEPAAHKKPWTPRRHEFGSRAFCKYAQLVGPARAGAVTHPGGAGETRIYANM